MNPSSFLSNCTSGGCGAKIGPGELSGLLEGLPSFSDEALLVGFDASDDAAVYALDEMNCVISTADFFSPMVEDPYTFVCIAAANAMSDVWAMGGRVALALNLVCFPEAMELSALGEILKGGAEKIKEAGAVLGGGHSIYDKEPKYGLAVTGLVEKNKVIRNNTLREGDALILTKPLGVGIVLAAARAQQADAEDVAAAVETMKRLNRYAAEKMTGFAVSACTDVTGFGLLTHLFEMLVGRFSVRLNVDALPVLPGAKSYADEFLLTAAGQRNRNHIQQYLQVEKLPFAMQELLFDPQTSGGLLISVPQSDAGALLQDIRRDDSAAAVIGTVLPKQATPIVFE